MLIPSLPIKHIMPSGTVATIQRVTRKEKSENPPPLYDLTTLQRDANRLLGYSAQQTLDYVQSLYEKKLTTYPRTDSCYITDDDEEMLEELTEELEGFLDIAPEDVDEAVPRTRRTVNREKVTDHHAILPTRSMLQADLDALPKGEQNVLKLIIARTLMAVSKPFRYLETLLTTECAGEEFTAKGKEVLEEGWKAVERKVLADILNRKQELTALPNAAENECGILNAELKEGRTSPPKHFTEDTLLHAMETASADSMPEGVERQGIGTPATRAATIEKLVQKGFLERKGTKKTKVLLPTDKGKALIAYVYGDAVFIPDLVFNNGDKTVTRPEVVGKIIQHKINVARGEANNGGDEYCDVVDSQLRQQGYHCSVRSQRAPSGQSKLSRIIQYAPDIKRFYFLDEKHQSKEYKAFMEQVTMFTQLGKVPHDDAPDSLAQLADELYNGISKIEPVKRPF